MPASTAIPTVTDAARRLADAARTRRPCPPVRDLIGADDIDTAYRVQALNTGIRVAQGRRIVGRKIGLTSPAVQKQLGVDQPDVGVLFDDMDCTNHARIRYRRLLQPKIEAEIAFTVADDITTEITAADAPTLVDRAYAAFEIVDSRIARWDITIADTVADNASCGLYVLGESIDAANLGDLSTAQMTMSHNGAEVSNGRGADCLGSPWQALAWLANTAIRYRTPLRAGDVVLSGALGPMFPVEPRATYTASISDIGTVTTTFTS